MYMTKLAFLYAKKSYLLDSVSQKDPKHLLTMTVDLAELAVLMSDHKESMRYALDGIKLAQKEKDKGCLLYTSYGERGMEVRILLHM